jgi:2-amino-4-hydroxy-6-hydroxymethyldihydropteridine diphosphokinase
VPQPDYLNTVAVGHGGFEPEELLAGAQAVEAELGRRRGERGAPRTIDVDLLVVGDLVRSSPELTLPHPRLRERRFVLAPLADLLPDLPLPPDRASPRQLLARLPVRPWAVRLGAPVPS